MPKLEPIAPVATNLRADGAAAGAGSESATATGGTPPASPDRQRGLALIAVLLLLLVSLGIGLLSSTASRTELRIAHNDVLDKRALAVAEAGLSEARQRIAAHGVLNDELANNGTGSCAGAPGNGLGSGSPSTPVSGLSNIGNIVTIASDTTPTHCYRFAGYPDATSTTDGYYVRVEDNHDEVTGTDNPLNDTDSTIYIVSHGVVGTAERIVKGLYTIVPAFGIHADHDVTIDASTVGNQAHPLNVYAGHSILKATPPGSGGPHLCVANSASCAVYGKGFYGATVANGPNFWNGVSLQALPTLPAVAACSPFSPNSGITGGSYNVGTGDLTVNSAVAILAAGTYCFHNITLNGGSGRLQVSGPVIINMTGILNFQGGSQVNNTTSNPDNLIINMSSTSTTAATVSGGTGSYMRINAPNPNALVNLQGGTTTFHGSINSYDVLFQGGGTITDDTATSTITLDNWREVQN